MKVIPVTQCCVELCCGVGRVSLNCKRCLNICQGGDVIIGVRVNIGGGGAGGDMRMNIEVVVMRVNIGYGDGGGCGGGCNSDGNNDIVLNGVSGGSDGIFVVIHVVVI